MVPVFTALKPLAFKAGRVFMQHLPTILTAAGSAGLVTATVMAVKATSKVEDITNATASNLKLAEDARNGLIPVKEGETYSEEDYKKDVLSFKIRGAGQIAKVYLPSVLIGTASLACIFGGHIMMLQRLAAMTAAYTGVATSFKDYRARVTDELGAEADHRFLNGIHSEARVIDTVQNPDGTETKVLDSVEKSTVPTDYDPYRVLFADETSKIYRHDDPHSNVYNIRRIESMMNDLLNVRKGTAPNGVGIVFKNEILDALGMDRTPDGQLLGISTDTRYGDGFVDFGLKDTPEGIRFLNYEEPNVWLRLNCDTKPVYNRLTFFPEGVKS